MIKIKVYKNGYEIIGHSEEKICHQVSMWHWIAFNLVFGYDKNAKEYTSERDNKDNPHEGYTWITYYPTKDLAWIIEDFVISAKRWGKDNWGDEVVFEEVDGELIKN